MPIFKATKKYHDRKYSIIKVKTYYSHEYLFIYVYDVVSIHTHSSIIQFTLSIQIKSKPLLFTPIQILNQIQSFIILSIATCRNPTECPAMDAPTSSRVTMASSSSSVTRRRRVVANKKQQQQRHSAHCLSVNNSVRKLHRREISSKRHRSVSLTNSAHRFQNIRLTVIYP